MSTLIADGLTKRFGRVVAVDDLSFALTPAAVTGFLGPNGAGKTTTLRMLLGLAAPSAGTATIDGRPYHALSRPLLHVGAVLEADTFHPGRSAREHLRLLATASGIGTRRVDDVLGLVGLEGAATRRVRGFSLGMRQRLALGTAMLGDPATLILDEPFNGLDPEGIRWLRGFLRDLAAEGRTILVSSHGLTELATFADEVLIVDRGRKVAHGPLAAMLADREAGHDGLESLFLSLTGGDRR